MSDEAGAAWPSEGLFEDLFENAPCGYLVMSPDGRIERANGILCRWLDLTPTALHGRAFRNLLTVPARIIYETNGAPLLRLKGGFEEMALDLLAADGRPLPVLANATEKRDSAGRLEVIRVALCKAAERRGYERDLRGRESAAIQDLTNERATSTLREQFIAVLGHDLRNPLASIRGGATLLAKQPLDARGEQVVALMQESVGRMAGLIDNVLDFARGRLGGGLTLVREPCRLEPILEQVVAELRVGSGRTIATDLRINRPIDCDRGRIGQLVSNLVGNAITHGAADQPITVAALVADGMLVVSVTNGGESIPASALPNLFQPFERGTLRPSLQGLGLGLYICSEIARAHDGALAVESDVAGTTFTFRMPIAD